MATPAQPQAQPPPRALLLHRLPTLPRQSHPMEHTILTQRCRSIKREMIRPKARSIPPTTTAAATLSIPVPWLRRAPLPLHSPRCSSSWRETNLDRCTTSSRPPSRRQPSRKTLGGRTKVQSLVQECKLASCHDSPLCLHPELQSLISMLSRRRQTLQQVQQAETLALTVQVLRQTRVQKLEVRDLPELSNWRCSTMGFSHVLRTGSGDAQARDRVAQCRPCQSRGES